MSTMLAPVAAGRTTLEQTTGRVYTAVTAATYLVKMRFLSRLDVIDDENYAESSSSFGFLVYPLNVETVRMSMRLTSGTYFRDVDVEDLDVDYTFACSFSLTGELRLYANGVQLGATENVNGAALLFSTGVKLQLGGSGTFRRRIKFIEAAVCDDTFLTPADMTAYQAGTPLGSLSATVHHIYAMGGTQGNLAATLTDTGASANDDIVQITGPTSGGLEPVFVDEVDVFTVDLDYNMYLQRTDATTYSGEFTGTYGTTVPTGIEYRVYNLAGVLLTGFTTWQALAGFSAAGNVWAGSVAAIPAGKDHVIQFRFTNDTTRLLYTSQKSVGAIIVWGGQSNPERTVAATLTTPATPLTDAYIGYSGTYDIALTAQMAHIQNANAAQTVANNLRLLLGVPVLLVMVPIGATDIADMIPGQPKYDTFIGPVINSLGGFEAAFFGQGENDVGSDLAVYQANADIYIGAMVTASGRTLGTDFNFLWTMLGRSTNSASIGPWAAFRAMQDAFPDTRDGVYLAGHAIDADMADFLHYSNDWYVIWGRRIVKSYGKVLGLGTNFGVGARVGPLATAGNTITIPVYLNGGTDLIKDTVATATGFTAYTNDTAVTPLTITDIQYVAPNIVITTSEVPTDDAIVRHMWPDNPNISNSFATTGNDIDDIGLIQFQAIWAPAQNLGWRTTAGSELLDSSGALAASITLDKVVFKGAWDDTVGPIIQVTDVAVDASGLIEYASQSLGAAGSTFDALMKEGDDFWLIENQTVIDLDA